MFGSSPMDIAMTLASPLPRRQAKVNGQDYWDLERPLEGSVSLDFLDFDHPEGKRCFGTSARVLGEACEATMGVTLSHGPPTDDGFFYDMSIDGGEGVVQQSE